jgi:serine/threonine-protein kinase RsbW
VDISPLFRYEVQGGKEIVGQARAWAAQVAAQLDADRQAIADFALAVSEAATNVVQYAYPAAQVFHLVISARRIGERIVFRLRDYGHKFDPSEVRPPTTAGELGVGGYGIYLMQHVMDDVRFVTTHPVGTELILIRRRKA